MARMQILFVHPNFPAQFGPVARWLARRDDVDCVFLSQQAEGERDGIRCIPFELRGGARRETHYCSRTFENAVWRAHAVYRACKEASDLRPDLIVGHSGFGSTAMLPELFDCPIVNLFEFFYHPHDSDMDFRPEYPPREIDHLRARMRNAMILIDLHTCASGYSPTRWQKDLFPAEWASKIEVIHDGVDVELWQRRAGERRIGDETIDPGTRIVTYAARGLESMRGFDVFVRVAKRIAAERDDVLFVVAGGDETHYGNDLRHTGGVSFREHVLRTERPDPARFRFLGLVPPEELARVLSLGDLHVYLTVPFVLSWSVLDAMACECTVLASDTAPVREVLRHGENALLADFFDVDGLAAAALEVLDDPAGHRKLGRAARRTVVEGYSTAVTLPRLWDLFSRVSR